MGDVFYETVRLLGRHAFFVNSRPLVIDRHHADRRGAFILAANHQSPFDVPLLIRHVWRHVDFVSITEVFEKPFVGAFYGAMNAFPLDRSRADAKTVRVILDRLERGRIVGMFPEGGFRRGATSVVHSRRIKPGIGRIATIAKVPIVPCVIVGSGDYARWQSWLPLRRTRYGMIFGEPIEPTLSADDIERELVERFVSLHDRLRGALGRGILDE